MTQKTKLRVKIVANNCNWPSWPQKLEEMRAWFSPKLDLQFELVHTSFKNVPFVNYPNNTNGGKSMDGVEPLWYDANIDPLAVGFDIVMLVMNVAEWKGRDARGWRTDKAQGPVELQVAADENEHIYLPPNSRDVGTTFLNYGRHEILHALFMLTGQNDTTHYWWDKGVDQLGNALAELVFPEPKTPEPPALPPTVMEIAFKWLTSVLAWLKGGQQGKMPEVPPELLPPNQPEMKKATLVQFCAGIQGMEGYYAPGENKNYPNGTRAWKNKNPGNIKFVGQALAIGADAQGFCIFRTYEDGLTTLKNMVKNVAAGKSKVYRADMTFTEFFRVYAPSSDGNYPEKYARFVADKCGVGVDTRINQLVI